MIFSVIVATFASVDASMPTTNINYPPGVSIGSVTGMVSLSSNGATTALGGAYVAIVNSYDITQEYASTTSDQYGEYAFAGVNVTGDPHQYRIYAEKSPYGEGYSAAFDASTGTQTLTSVIIFAPDTTATPIPTPTPTVAPTPTSMPTPTSIPATPTPTLAATLVSTPTITSTPTVTSLPVPTAGNDTTAKGQMPSNVSDVNSTTLPVSTASPTAGVSPTAVPFIGIEGLAAIGIGMLAAVRLNRR